MRVNCHVHVFNLRQVVTPRTREVVRNRLLAEVEDSIPSASLRETLADAVVEAADGLSDFNEEELLRRFLDRLTGHEDVRECLDGLRVDELPDEVRPLLAGRLEGLALRGLRRIPGTGRPISRTSRSSRSASPCWPTSGSASGSSSAPTSGSSGRA